MSRLISLTDRAILRVAGEGSGHFLQGLCTQDMQRFPAHVALPAAFLSPKGKLLCDTLIKQQDTDEYLVDCHAELSGSLRRLLLRHKLRQPLKIEDVSKGYHSVALLPEQAFSEPRAGPELEDHFFPDPRFRGLGQRAILPTALQPHYGAELEHYHRWRVSCAVPEGPRDLKVDEVMPLHGNLDLLDFISFSKGCYVGQELLTRTKHRGAVRRRIFLAESSASPVAAVPEPWAPRPLQATDAPGQPQLPQLQEEPVFMDEKQVGNLHSACGHLALVSLRCEQAHNELESFQTPPLPQGRELVSAKLHLVVRPPPYVFE